MESSLLANILGPKPSLITQNNQKFQLEFDNYVYLGHPVNMDSLLFHLVIVLKARGGNVENYYQHVVLPLTRGLMFEQERRGFVKKEADTILHWRESNAMELQTLPALEQESTLVRDLVKVYRGLRVNQSVSIDLNNSFHLTLFAPDKATKDIEMPALRPFHSLILLQDPEQVLERLPPDASPSLVDFIRSVTPMQSFEEMQVVLDCSLAHVYRLASHLIHWKKAKLINQIQSRNVYVVSPNAPLDQLPALSLMFSSLYSYDVEFAPFLSLLSSPCPLSTLIPRDKRPQYLDMVSYMLQHNLISQLHMYISVMIPRELVKGELTPTSAPLDVLDDFDDVPMQEVEPSNYIIPDPGNATDEEQEALQTVAETQPEPWRGLFLQLVEYFNGTFTVEEIMFRERVSRKDMRNLLVRFKEVVITLFHE